MTFGLKKKAHLAPDPDAGHQLIGSAWFLTELDEPTENRVADIVRSAVLGQTAPTPRPSMIPKIGPKARMAAFGMKWGYKHQLDKLDRFLRTIT